MPIIPTTNCYIGVRFTTWQLTLAATPCSYSLSCLLYWVREYIKIVKYRAISSDLTKIMISYEEMWPPRLCKCRFVSRVLPSEIWRRVLCACTACLLSPKAEPVWFSRTYLHIALYGAALGGPRPARKGPLLENFQRQEMWANFRVSGSRLRNSVSIVSVVRTDLLSVVLNFA
jgi:hypothetical protein